MTIRPLVCTAALLLSAGSVLAGELPRTDILREGYYLAPLASVLKADARRGTGNGAGATFAAGHQGDDGYAAFELELFYLRLKHASDNGSTSAGSLAGGGIAALLFPFAHAQAAPHLYGVFGAGAQAHGAKTLLFDAGAGYLFQFSAHDLALRVEARYRWDTQQPPAGGSSSPGKFNDVLFNVGLQIPLSAPPAPPAPAPIVVVPPAPPPDDDDDGVINERDHCPGTPAGVKVDDSGCPLPPRCAAAGADAAVELAGCKAGDTLVLQGVHFETNQATLTEDAQAILDQVAAALVAVPAIHAQISGHTDDVGKDAANRKLSEARAQAVREYLTAHGVDAARLSAQGYGESQPVADNTSEQGRAQNRRVELRVLEAAPAPVQETATVAAPAADPAATTPTTTDTTTTGTP